MSAGRLARLAIVTLLVVAPLAAAATPTPNLTTAASMGGQDVTGLAVDPSGQFAAAVVAYDNARLTTPGGILPGGTTTTTRDDVYLCDFGSAIAPTTGQGCRGLRHAGTVVPAQQAPGYAQRVDATAEGPQGVFVVGGPGRYTSLWRSTSNVPVWTVASADGENVLNVSITHDASRVITGVAPATGGGSIEVRNAKDLGKLIWSLPLENAEDAAVRPTALDVARTGEVLAIGTEDGLLVTKWGGSTAPTGDLGGISQAEAVSEVILSADGKYVVAGAQNGVFLATIGEEAGTGKPTIAPASVFNRGFGTPVQDVAFTVDGSRFAAAAGTRIHFFRRLDTGALAEPVGEAYDTGATVGAIAYDASGDLLVAVSGSKVFGFGPSKNAPMWSFDATQTAFGALDGPLRKVSVSDDAQRIIVAGKTKTMAYSSVLGVTASLASTNSTTTLAPTQTMGLTLTVRNTGSLSDTYNFSVVPPIGAWQTESLPAVTLDPDEVRTLRFNLTAPPGGEPGVYGVQVRVLSALAQERNPGAAAAAGPAFNITIPRSVVLKVEAPDDRLLLRQGGEQTISVTLRNEGNANGVVNLTARQELTRGASWDVRFQPEQVNVPAAGSAQVSMIVTAPSDSGSGDRNIITIRAREGDLVEATDQVTAYVDAQFGAELRTNQTSWEFYPGQVQTIRLNVTNIGNTEDVYNLTSAITPAAVESDWRVTIELPNITVARGQTKQVTVTVKAVAADAEEATLTLRTISQASPDRTENSLVLNLATIPRPPTDEEKDSLLPAPPLFPLLAAVALAALLLRRGGRR